ncbi:hypothetical protein EYR36_010589 [Pleurotus pulmonarius]|nr:hypothetical protein EYR36_010589 [Pleurotus pulmonarius]
MQQTTVAELIAILSQLDASLVTTLPPGIQAPTAQPANAPAAQPANVPAAAAQPANAPAAAAQPANVPAAAAQPANVPAAAAQPANVPAAAAQPANVPAAAAQPANVPAAAAQPANAPAQPASATATANPLAVFAAMFRCPNCDTVHFLSPINGPPPVVPPIVPSAPPASQAATSAGAAGVTPYVPPFGAYLFGPSASQFSAPPSTPSSRSIAPASTPGCADPGSVPPMTPSMSSGRWYSVTYGRQIGVFQDWFGVVEPLVSGVPSWKCKSFSTLAAATAHFNAHVAAGQTGIYVDN